MKRKMSFAFVIMCFITIMSFGGIIGSFQNIFSLFKHFSLMRILKTLCNIINTFTSAAIVALLYFNQKQDIKPKAHLVLIICGCARLLSAAIGLPSLIQGFGNPLYAVMPLVTTATSVVLGALLIVVAQCIKGNKTNGAVKSLAFSGICLGVFTLLGSVMPYISQMGGPSLMASLNVILLALGLWCLPKTFYDYDNCFFFGGNAIRLLVAISAVVVFIAIVSGSIINDGGSNGGNCFNCGGDGWDDTNSCRCIWCGGDGYSSWNP